MLDSTKEQQRLPVGIDRNELTDLDAEYISDLISLGEFDDFSWGMGLDVLKVKIFESMEINPCPDVAVELREGLKVILVKSCSIRSKGIYGQTVFDAYTKFNDKNFLSGSTAYEKKYFHIMRGLLSELSKVHPIPEA